MGLAVLELCSWRNFGVTKRGLGLVFFPFFFFFDKCFSVSLSLFLLSLSRNDPSGKAFFSGYVYLRPEHTIHVVTRRFWDKEVFASLLYEIYAVSDILGKCYVSSARDYFASFPKGLSPADIYFVLSKYYDRSTSYAKIRDWKRVFHSVPIVVPGEIVLRERAHIPRRVHSPLYVGPELDDDPAEIDNLRPYLDE